MIITLGIVMMLLLALAFVLFFYFSQQKFQVQQLAAQQQQLNHQQQLLISSIQVQEEERQRLARELHDEVGSKLNVINLGLHRLRKHAMEIPDIKETLQDIFGVVDMTITTTRRIAHDLLPPTLEKFGLATALEELCEQHKQGDFNISFTLQEQQPLVIDQVTALNFFRVVQELLSNSIKHASADNISILLSHNDQEIRLAYQDDGQGFSLKGDHINKGLGMQNIESRLQIINATYRLESEPGKGLFFQSVKRKS
ncbi:sensor histidine kinase [Lewinella cohaerens]|uniref:sensor histidine kinase n=1 Tax=Lewinella cohaerens TaxID=70995 RepID=UPI000368CD7B|nr:histidine kinase [Lewinella cohaerens]